MNFRGYEKYANSGIDWLGEIPNHWNVKRLKYICNIFPSNIDKKSYEGEIPASLCNYTDVYYNDHITKEMEFMEATASEEQIAKFVLRAGDVVVTKDSETADDIAIAAYVPSDLPGVVCGYHLSIIRPSDGNNGLYVKRLFDSHYLKSCVAILANGLTRVGLSQSALDNLAIPLPPPKEQTAIAAFLDRETSKIDALIAEKQRLIELLKEKRQAVISHAVTKGLNPNVPMKDSGVDWLGRIPDHWELKPLKYIVRLLTEKTERREHSVALENIASWSSRYIPTDTKFEGEGVAFHPGDILFGKLRPYLAKAWMAEFFGEAIGDFHVMRPVANICGRFFLYQVLNKEFISIVDGATFGSKMPRVSWDFMASLLWAIPPKSEQTAIAAFLDRETSKIDALTAQANQAIALLQERRTALISAAVTGKIDVREATKQEAS